MKAVAQSSHAILEKEKNILQDNLVSQNSIIFPSLHIMLGLNSQFIKAIVKSGQNEPTQRLHKMFPKLTAAKINAGVFIGPNVHKILKDKIFFQILPKNFQGAFKDVVNNFLRNTRAPNYVELLQNCPS